MIARRRVPSRRAPTPGRACGGCAARSDGCRSRRRVPPDSSEPTRSSGGEALAHGPRRRRGSRLEAAAGRGYSRRRRWCWCTRSSPAHQWNLVRSASAQRAGVGVGGGDEPVGLDARQLQHRASRRARRGASPRRRDRRTLRCGVLGQGAAGARSASRPRRDVLEAVLGDRVAGAPALGQPADHLGRAFADRVQVASGITSRVTRSTPWSSSQSRIRAQRSKVAGSIPCRATAIRGVLVAVRRTPLTCTWPIAACRWRARRRRARVS